MKKIVFLLAFLGCTFLAQAKTNPETTLKTFIPTLKDSVVIEFGKAGRIVILVESLADFEKLKGMNINQIIAELGVQENKATGEVTLVELHKKDGSIKEVVRVLENGAETEVRVGRMRVYVDESGQDTKVKFETNPKKERGSRYTSDFSVDLGINSFLKDGSFPTSDQPYASKGWGSWNVGLNWVGSQRLSDGLRWNFGLGFQWYNFKFENRDFLLCRAYRCHRSKEQAFRILPNCHDTFGSQFRKKQGKGPHCGSRTLHRLPSRREIQICLRRIWTRNGSNRKNQYRTLFGKPPVWIPWRGGRRQEHYLFQYLRFERTFPSRKRAFFESDHIWHQTSKPLNLRL